MTVLESLERYGLLLFSDPALPSLVALVAGEPVRGSWMVHPRGHAIYAAMNALEDDPAVLTTKLIGGKVTYVHRRLWSAVLAVASSREPWQMDGLSSGARWLLSEVDALVEVVTDGLAPPPATSKRVADLARELERHLLVHSTEIHTPRGSHAKVLQTWQRWAAGVSLRTALPPERGRAQLQAAAAQLAATGGTRARLPWESM